MMNKQLAILPFILSPVQLSPVVFPFKVDNDNPPTIPHDFCILTPNYGHRGSVKFVEDCEHLDIFPTLPIPGPATQKYGIHPVVCCPNLSTKNICFPTDTYCPTYVKPPPPSPPPEETTTFPDSETEQLEIVTVAPIFIKPSPKVSDEDCTAYAQIWGNTTKCVNFKDCPGIFKQPFNPSPIKNPAYAGFCGWDTEDKAAKVCCPGAQIQEKALRDEVEPRYPGYQCRDKVKQCKKWKNNNACRTDMDFVIDPQHPDNGRANSGVMFDFIMGTCMETCQFCQNKGCRDEHPDCPDWARQGFCVTNSLFLTHTCRESCGICGFLSADDTKVQVVGKNTYTDFRDSKFDCGRYKQLTEVNNTKKEEELIMIYGAEEEDNLQENEDYDIRSGNGRQKRQDSLDEDEEVDVFFSNDSPSIGAPNTGIKFCGASLVTDKWIVTASHCYDDLGQSISQARQVKINTVRDNTVFKEVIEIKRIYKHPKYVYPHLYNDIALLELGRRVEYNWEKYGDSPMCIDRVGQNVNKTATVQGYGQTESGEVSKELLEANVTVISNTKCKKTLDFNTTGKPTSKAKIKHGLPNGLSDQMFCAQGEENENGTIRGACKGDSGGPLFAQREDGRRMLIGIVSGGLGCGQGYPGWYTKVAFFASWIECIIDNSKIYNNKKSIIEKECNKVADKVDEESPDDYIFGGDLRSTDEDDDYYEADDEYGNRG